MAERQTWRNDMDQKYMAAMDTLERTGKWLDALNLLFEACKPLTNPCDMNPEDREKTVNSIEHRAFYCLHVKLALQDGVQPLTFAAWSEKEKAFKVEAQAVKGRVDKDHFLLCNDCNAPINRCQCNLPRRNLQVKKIDPIDRQEFGDDLTAMFGGDYPSKTTRKEYRPEPPLGDDVRMTAKYGRRDEDDPKRSE
jgi:hypothetical protein